MLRRDIFTSPKRCHAILRAPAPHLIAVFEPARSRHVEAHNSVTTAIVSFASKQDRCDSIVAARTLLA